MKLNWFSPLPPASTDIAHYTTRVIRALVSRAEVTLWTDQSEWDADLNNYTEVRRYHLQQMPWEELNRGDASIYHIGNNPLFHGTIWQVSRQHSGVIVLHDVRLHHLFDGLYREQWCDQDAYLAEMEFYYGEKGRRDAAECFRTNARNIDYMAEHYPLTLLALENALGVIVHTQKAFDNLKQMNSWPVAYAPLPFAAMPRLYGDGRSRDSKRRAEGPPYRLIVFGYIGRNRRLDSLLEALAGLTEKGHFRVDVYGQILESERVRDQVRSLGLQKLVGLHGFVPETELDEALAGADLAVNLRYPTMGEASGSQLRIWAHALPSLVSQVGWYSTLPTSAVAFVRPDHETADIKTHLSAFLADPTRFAKLGEKGRRILEKQHAPERYARSIVDFAAIAQRFRPRAASYKLAERAGALMGLWVGSRPANEAINRVAAEIYGLIEGG